MVTTVRSLGLNGIAGYEVAAECFLSGGLPAFDIVGSAGRRRPGGPGAGPGSGEKLRSKISRQPHHRQSGPRGHEKGGHGLRSAYFRRAAGGRRRSSRSAQGRCLSSVN